MEIDRLNPDNLRIGENIRAALKHANLKKERSGLNWVSLAKAVPMHPVALKKAVGGKVGLSEEKILALGTALGIHPGHLIAGVSQRAREDRFPHIPAPTNRNKRDTARKGMAVASVEALIKNPAIISSFFGGVPKEQIPFFSQALLDLRARAVEIRRAAIDNGNYDPVTRTFEQ